jgi:hypothetical protein
MTTNGTDEDSVRQERVEGLAREDARPTHAWSVGEDAPASCFPLSPVSSCLLSCFLHDKAVPTRYANRPMTLKRIVLFVGVIWMALITALHRGVRLGGTKNE